MPLTLRHAFAAVAAASFLASTPAAVTARDRHHRIPVREAKSNILDNLVIWEGADDATVTRCRPYGRASWECRTRTVYLISDWGDRLICRSMGRTFGARSNSVTNTDFPEMCRARQTYARGRH